MNRNRNRFDVFRELMLLTHCSLEIPKRVIGKKQNAASDQGLHCLQIVQPFFSKNI